MRQNTPSDPTVTLRELAPSPGRSGHAGPPERDDRDQVVFVTNAVRRRGGLRSRSDHHRPVLAAVVR